MRKTAWLLFLCVVIGIASSGPASGGDARTFHGEYVWTQGSTGDLEAVFTPNGEDRWTVRFQFTFRGEAHTYSGEAEGSLIEGALEGRVLNETKKRTFTFSGEFEDGEFRGTHAEIGEGRTQRTGTLTLAE